MPKIQEAFKEDNMKKLIILLMVLGVIFAGISFSQADTSRTIPYKSVAITTTGVAVVRSVTIYRITGVANGTNTSWGLYDTATKGDELATNVKVEGGEASQYEAYGPYDFGEEGLNFDTGLTAIVTSAHLVVIYR